MNIEWSIALTPIAVIINAGAGAGHPDELADSLRDKFARHGLKADVTVAKNGDEIIGAARAAVERRVGIIVAGGGDGTINAVAAQVVGSESHFGVLPLGTLNHFAKDLGIPLTLDEAIRNVAEGTPRAVDVGEVNDQVFLNNSSLGLYPDIVRDREKQQRRLGRGKWLAAGWATVAALRRYPFLSVRVVIDGEEHARRTPFVFIGNNEYTMSGLSIGARERLDAGTLSLYVAQRPGRLGLLRLAWHALRGTLENQRDFDVLRATDITLHSGHTRMRVATDGEVTVMATPLRYRIRSKALMVLAPANS